MKKKAVDRKNPGIKQDTSGKREEMVWISSFWKYRGYPCLSTVIGTIPDRSRLLKALNLFPTA